MDKLIFAHQLRGIAALSVVVSHLVGVFWGMRQTVAETVAAPVQQTAPPSYVSIAFNPDFNFGPFGVALFFLISGFVISFSIQKMDGKSFLLSRTFRIFPVYIFCTILSLFVISLSTRYWNTTYQSSIGDLLANFLLIHNYLGIPSIDLVNWSLAVEVKFYLAAALLSPFILKCRLCPLYLLSGIVLLVNLEHMAIINVLGNATASSVLNQLLTEFTYISYMLIGVVFYYHHTKQIGTVTFVTSLALLCGTFLLTWKSGVLAPQYASVTVNYLYALAVFAIAYLARNRFRPVFVLDRLADISYPLYLLHSLIGYSLLNILMDNGLSYSESLLVAITVILLLSYLVHRCVEMPAITTGKKLIGLLGKVPKNRSSSLNTAGT